MRQPPAHAGRLRPPDRIAFGLVFALMATFAAIFTISAAKTGGFIELTQPGAPARGGALLPAVLGQGSAAAGSASHRHDGLARAGARIDLDKQLSAGLISAIGADPAQISTAVSSKGTGIAAFYHPGLHFYAASFQRLDILATLLLQHQDAGTMFTVRESRLASLMIEESSNAATADLWNLAGGADAVSAANKLLGLGHTAAVSNSGWSQVATTATDQIRLLQDLTSARSPLNAANRKYELSLMTSGANAQTWSWSAWSQSAWSELDGARLSYAMTVAAPQGGGLWVANSIGIVRLGGRDVLIAVVSAGSPTMIAAVQTGQAAVAVASDIVEDAR